MNQQRKADEHGFTAIEALLIIVIVGIVAGIGYWVVKQHTSLSQSQIKLDNSAVVSAPAVSVKTTQGFANALNQNLSGVAKTTDESSNSYSSAAQSDSTAVSNLGDVYNESNY